MKDQIMLLCVQEVVTHGVTYYIKWNTTSWTGGKVASADKSMFTKAVLFYLISNGEGWGVMRPAFLKNNFKFQNTSLFCRNFE